MSKSFLHSTILQIRNHLIYPKQSNSDQPISQQELNQIQAVLERILLQNIVPFWYPQILDREKGGYQLNHNLHGQWKGEANKALVTQARTLWFFARLNQSPYGDTQYLEAAQHGYEFLRNSLWDHEFGGCYWQVNAQGDRATQANKELYGQAFALYALSEYTIASGDDSAASLAHTLFHLLETYAHDPLHGGYCGFLQQNWQPAPANTWSYLGLESHLKSMNAHLHLLEALITYSRINPAAIVRERLLELVVILSNTVVRKSTGTCAEQHHSDWTPLNGIEHQRVSYGHDLENIWLLVEACRSIKLSHSLFLDFYRSLFRSALCYGFDKKQGGFYESGTYNSVADRRTKIWWVQAESLVAALQMYCLTEEWSYWNYFCRVLDWIVKYQVDWENGDWHAEILPNGQPSGDKAGDWKAPYHNGRAILHSLELLTLLAG